MTEQLLVEKRSHPADVFPADGRVIEAVVFFSEYAQSHGGPQTVKDLIDEPGHVVPALDADGEFLLIQKDAISAMPSLRPTRIWTDTGTKLR